MFYPFLTSAVLVTLAELGDKTQMLSLVLAARHSARRVLLGIIIAITALQTLAVTAGGLVGSFLPSSVIAPIAGVLFIGFGVITLRNADRGEKVEEYGPHGAIGSAIGIAGMFFVSELGDKTQLMTISLAADPASGARALSVLGVSVATCQPSAWSVIGVWLGSMVGMLLVNGLAVAVGVALGARLSPEMIARVSGVVFIVFGLLTIASAVFGG